MRPDLKESGLVPPDLVIFDCDGVLVDSEAIATRIIARHLTEAGLPMTADAAIYQFLGGKLTMIQKEAEAILGRELGDDWVPTIYAEQFEVYRRELRTIPGIEAALDAIQGAGLPICVGSNGPPDKMEVTLGVTGLKPRFEGRIFSADMVGIPKPEPDLYLFCAEKMGAEPSRCVVIEDSPRGATAGIRAGMRVLGYAAGHGPEKLIEVGAEPFMDMAELPGLLGVKP